jgi:2,3-bisphosphoglycerate-independent phosphoglycerate mutase
VRVNFATVDEQGNVTDRRAGRISTELNRELCQRVRDAVRLDFDGEYFFETESGHRAVLVLRGDQLHDEVTDSDPQQTGKPPLQVQPLARDAQYTAELVQSFTRQVFDVLKDEPQANAILMRGFQCHEYFPTIKERYGLSGLCVAQYPMYRGVSRLIGMEVAEPPESTQKAFESMAQHYKQDEDSKQHNFYFLHVKGTDTSGEDGNHDRKVAVIEEVDALLPILLEVKPDVMVVTGDHSTPPQMSAHSWHPVPVMISAAAANCDGIEHFDEQRCRGGSLGLRPGMHLMGLALAHARRLKKFGA